MVKNLTSIADRLDRVRVTGGGLFAIRYAMRNPPPGGRGGGVDGVESEELIEAYAEGIDHACSHLTGLGWGLPAPDPSTGRVPVYVYDAGRPFTSTRRRRSLVALRSDNGEPTREGMLRRARLEAAHEAVHTFTHPLRPERTRHRDLPDPWDWFDEATATFVERHLYPDYQEGLLHAHHWAARPELSLERDVERCPGGDLGGWPGGYASAWFLHYLVPRFGWGLLHDVWRAATEAERPVLVLERLLGGGRYGPSDAGPAFADLFAAYCADSYDLARFAPAVHRRFGDRGVTARLAVPSGGEASFASADALDHLSCRYFHLDLPAGADRLSVKLLSQAPGRPGHLRAALLVPRTDPHPPAKVLSGSRVDRLCCDIPHGSLGFAVFVVVNTFIPATRLPVHQDTQQRFRFTASA